MKSCQCLSSVCMQQYGKVLHVIMLEKAYVLHEQKLCHVVRHCDDVLVNLL